MQIARSLGAMTRSGQAALSERAVMESLEPVERRPEQSQDHRPDLRPAEGVDRSQSPESQLAGAAMAQAAAGQASTGAPLARRPALRD